MKEIKEAIQKLEAIDKRYSRVERLRQDCNLLIEDYITTKHKAGDIIKIPAPLYHAIYYKLTEINELMHGLSYIRLAASTNPSRKIAYVVPGGEIIIEQETL